jgi:hypothetical protein
LSDITDYERAGWKLCAIEPGRKAPIYTGWQITPKPAADIELLGLGVGLLHAFSGTCALDIDDLDLARPWLAERGVDIDALLSADDAVRIDSGRPGRAKLLYRLSKPLRTYKPKGSGVELRCATADPAKSVQDVLPPTIHPDTKQPYEWLYGDLAAGHWSKLPPIPATLLAAWRSLGAESEAPAEPSAPGEPVELAKLRKAAFRHDPNCGYDEWIKVGMQLNEGTGGAQEGLAVWQAWSRKIKRAPYPGDQTLRTHWVSFGGGPGKHMARGAALVAELPAEADEFPMIEVEAPDAETTVSLLRAQLASTTKEALSALEARLVYVIASERYFDCERHKLIGSDNAIEHMFTSMMPKGKGGVRMNPVKALKASPTKRFAEAVAFHPGRGALFEVDGDKYANRYRNRLPEPIEPTKEELEKIDWLFGRIDDDTFRAYLLRLYAHVVQYPGVKINSAPLIWSETEGNGKTTLLKAIPELLVGKAYSKEVTSSLLNSDFNDYLLDAWHVNLTEFRAGTKGEREAITEKLKPWITDATISMHPKGLPGFSMPNTFFLTATSNKDDAASITSYDRRWAVHEMHAARFTEAEQQSIYPEFLSTNRAAAVLRHYFLHYPIGDFVPSAAAPETAARQEMVEAAVSSDVELLQIAFEQRTAPLDRDVVLTSEVVQYVHKHCPMKPSAHRIGRILAAPPIKAERIKFRVGHAVYRAIIIRNPEKWRGNAGKEIFAHISHEDVDLTT